VDGPIRALSGATIHETENIKTGIPLLYVGWHPSRHLFVDPMSLDLRWRGEPPRRTDLQRSPPDLCGTARPVASAYGAFEDFSTCMLRN
jgi:hypothetical protein